jgi:enoyl-CoA hydratase/carnithine racemase
VSSGVDDDLARYVVTERGDDGVVRLRMHTEGGPARYSLGLHAAWGRAWRGVADDPAARAVIVTGTGDAWLAGVAEDEPLFAKPFHEWPADAVDRLHRDRRRMLDDLVFGVDVPTIGVVNGPGFHTELALFCDLTLCTPDSTFFDGHYSAGQVPGDGMFLALRTLLGDKRAAYHLYLGEPVEAAEAQRLGLVNEVVPADRVQERALELAGRIAARPATTRRLTCSLVRRRLRRELLADHELAVTSGLLGPLVDRPGG